MTLALSAVSLPWSTPKPATCGDTIGSSQSRYTFGEIDRVAGSRLAEVRLTADWRQITHHRQPDYGRQPIGDASLPTAHRLGGYVRASTWTGVTPSNRAG